MQTFREAIDEYVDQLSLRHGERLVSLYLVGSVARDEAVPGLSDVNLLCVFRELPDADVEAAWNAETSDTIEARHPELSRVSSPGHPPPFPGLKPGAMVRGGGRYLFTSSPLHLPEVCPPEPDATVEATDEVLELHWGGRLLRGEELRPLMPPCPPPHLPHARSWAERARQVYEEVRRWRGEEVKLPEHEVTSSPPHPGHLLIRSAGHRLAKAALTCCLAVLVAEGQGFTLQSSVIAERIGERHPEWADWAQEFVRCRLDPPTTSEHLAALAEATRLLCDWSSTILHTIGLPHNLRV